MLGLDIRLESISLSGSSLGSSFVHADKDNASLRENSSTLHINIGHDIGVISFPLNEGSGNFSLLHIPIDSGLRLKDFIATIKYVSCTIINRHGKLQSYDYILSSYSCVLNLGIGFYDMSINPMKDLRLHPTTRRLVLHKSSS